jgi:hypothetical protein
MTDYLASLQSFTVQSSSVDEVVLKSAVPALITTRSACAGTRIAYRTARYST